MTKAVFTASSRQSTETISDFYDRPVVLLPLNFEPCAERFWEELSGRKLVDILARVSGTHTKKGELCEGKVFEKDRERQSID